MDETENEAHMGRAKIRSYANIIWVVCLCAGWFLIGWFAQRRFAGVDTELIDVAYHSIYNQSIYNELSNSELSYAAIRGMLSEINDPYAELIEPLAAQDLIATFEGNTGVIGLYAENLNGQVVIQIVYPGGPADEAGIEPGDIILSIDGKLLDQDVDSSETGLLIRGAPGTPIRLEILRGESTLEISPIRRQRQFVSTQILEGGIGYISLTAFNSKAAQDLKQALIKILEEEPSALVWDLRNNEGGDMQAAQEIIGFFIEDGPLFLAELNSGEVLEFRADGNALVPDLPLVVLMDESTYSAAETAAVAVAELGRGKTVGSESYGKGIIQATIPLVDDVMLQLTVAKWLSPQGKWYQENGVAPQIYVVDDQATQADEVLQKALEEISNKE